MAARRGLLSHEKYLQRGRGVYVFPDGFDVLTALQRELNAVGVHVDPRPARHGGALYDLGFYFRDREITATVRDNLLVIDIPEGEFTVQEFLESQVSIGIENLLESVDFDAHAGLGGALYFVEHDFVGQAPQAEFIYGTRGRLIERGFNRANEYIEASVRVTEAPMQQGEARTAGKPQAAA